MTKDVKLNLNKTLFEKAMEKMKREFKQAKIKITDFILIIILMGLYKKIDATQSDIIYIVTDCPDERSPLNYERKTVALHNKLLEQLNNQKNNGKGKSYDWLINNFIAAYIHTKLSDYTDCIAPLYTIVGYKNQTMQKKTADAVEKMQLDYSDMTLVDACCATGSLFWGLHSHEWKFVILNDLNPLRTNFLSVLQHEPLKLIKMILGSDLSFIENPDTKNPRLREYKEQLCNYAEKRKNYHKIDRNVEIAYKMFITQCIDKKQIENGEKIFNRVLRFLPAHLKMTAANAIITQEDCTAYLKDSPKIRLSKGNYITLDANRLLLLDPPYIGTESQCSVPGYDYGAFHRQAAEYLAQAKHPFLYYCRSSAPKGSQQFTEEAKHIMKQKLSDYFFDKGFYFDKVPLDGGDTTELMISNKNYAPSDQILWTNMTDDIFNPNPQTPM